jgi:transposase
MKHWSGKFIIYLSELDIKHKAMKLTLDRLLENLKYLRKELSDIIKNLRTIVKEDGTINKVIKHLLSVPGIGFVTAITLYTEIMEIERFMKFDQLSCFIGLTPDTESSGETEKTLGISNRQNKYLRNMLVESAWTAIRKDSALTMTYGNLIKRMSKQEAIVRIAKKLLSRIMHVWKHDEDYVCAVVA